jgi:hypothetical protein
MSPNHQRPTSCLLRPGGGGCILQPRHVGRSRVFVKATDVSTRTLLGHAETVCTSTPSSVTQRQAVCIRDSSSPLVDRDCTKYTVLGRGAPCNGLGQTTPPDQRAPGHSACPLWPSVSDWWLMGRGGQSVKNCRLTAERATPGFRFRTDPEVAWHGQQLFRLQGRA